MAVLFYAILIKKTKSIRENNITKYNYICNSIYLSSFIIMLTENNLLEQFGEIENINQDVFLCPFELPTKTINNYIKINDPQDLDFILISLNLRNDEFANYLFENLPEQIDLTTISRNPIPANKYGFSDILLVPPTYHSQLKGIFEKERESLIWCIPIHRYEFSGNESKEELQDMYIRTVPVQDWKRQGVPKIKIYFRNPKTKGGTINKNPVIFKYEYLIREIKNINGVENGFLEITNYKNEVIEIVSPLEGQYFLILNRDDSKRVLKTIDQIIEAVDLFLIQ